MPTTEYRINTLKIFIMKKHNSIISDLLVADVRTIIEEGRRHAFAAAGQAAILTYWHVGRRIVEEEQQGKARADYGKNLIAALADKLIADGVWFRVWSAQFGLLSQVLSGI